MLSTFGTETGNASSDSPARSFLTAASHNEMWLCVKWQHRWLEATTDKQSTRWLAKTLFSNLCKRLCQPDTPVTASITSTINSASQGPSLSKVDCCELMCIASILVAGKRLDCRLHNPWISDFANSESNTGHYFEDIARAERLLLRVLQWEVAPDTPSTVASQILSKADRAVEQKLSSATSSALDACLRSRHLFDLEVRVLGWAAVLYALQVNGLLESQLTDLAMGEANSTMIAARQCKDEIVLVFERANTMGYTNTAPSPVAVQDIRGTIGKVEQAARRNMLTPIPPRFVRVTQLCPSLKRPRPTVKVSGDENAGAKRGRTVVDPDGTKSKQC